MRSLRQLRRLRPMVQADLAKAVGVSTQTLGEWERGTMEPRVHHLRRLCEALGVPAEALWEEPPESGSPGRATR